MCVIVINSSFTLKLCLYTLSSIECTDSIKGIVIEDIFLVSLETVSICAKETNINEIKPTISINIKVKIF